MSDAALRKLFDRVDTDKGGTIGLDEFQELLEGYDGESAQPEPTARSAEATAHRAPPRAAPARAGGSVAGSSRAAELVPVRYLRRPLAARGNGHKFARFSGGML